MAIVLYTNLPKQMWAPTWIRLVTLVNFPPVPIYSVTVLNMSQSSNDVSNGLHGRGYDRSNGTIKSLQGLLYWELRTTRWKTYHFKFRKGCLRFNANQKYWKNVRYHEIRNENSTVYVSPTLKPLIMIDNKLVNHSEVGALPVGVASIISSFLTKNLASMDWAKITVRRNREHLSFVIWCVLY